MKKRAAVLAGILTLSLVLGGCTGSTGLETDAIKITKYKGVEVDEVDKPAEITDEDVDAAIQSTLESEATTTEITDRAVESGDTVSIDFVGRVDGEEFEGGSAQDYPLTIGSGVFIEGFEDSIIGHNVGDTFDWNGTFPEDYGNADMAGKAVVFTITVNSITVDEVPELTDDLVKTLSEESTTVDEYREEVKKDLEEESQVSYDATLEQNAWQAVLENTEVKEYPEGEVEEFADSLIQQYKEAAEYYQMDYETFIEEQMGYATEDFEAEVEAVAQESVKDEMAVEAIADKENIELTDEAYEEQLGILAENYGYEDGDAMKEAFDEEELRSAALKNLVMEFVKDNCIQVAGSAE
ncbi:MAG TPA: trigger factor [Candidatus Dorea gallistercoris]|uniref:peptidylprolyl isomerase n=1 Tax=Candidatus Dorea gallistercoris TaxID=2838542 RepID=A0A9D1RCI5_9FIRM|nr:trigger factor [Candidatus Dorea gallistercoris]